VIKQDQDTVAIKTKDYNSVLTDPANQGVSVTDITTKTAQVNQAQTGVAQAQTNITQAQTGITQAEANVAQAQAHITQAQANVVTAQNAVDDSQTTLDEDKSTPQTITAPFKGLITQVNVNVGDIVPRSTNLIEIAQPDLFEANILITENDIFSVKLGGDATVSLDALSGLTFPAQITKVSPTATISSGVVNYAVTVSLTSTQPLTSNPGLTGVPSAPFQTGTAPSTAKSFASPPAGTPPALSSAAGLKTPTNSSVSQAITLKQGLSATVEIISQQANNVLIIPSKAITSQGQNGTVQVVNGSTTETRIVKTGITDGTNTEITQGLNQGDVISYKTSSGTSSTTRSSPPQGIPGIGGGPPGGF
jgi:multidrug efflux pump subunit AcrA (membrane-fusion protein)